MNTLNAYHPDMIDMFTPRAIITKHDPEESYDNFTPVLIGAIVPKSLFDSIVDILN